MVEEQDSELVLFYVKGSNFSHYPPVKAFLLDRSLRLYRSVVPLCMDGLASRAEFEVLGTAPFVKHLGLRCPHSFHSEGEEPLDQR